MGYCVTYDINQVTIPAAKVQACLDAINALHTDANLLKGAGGGCSGPGMAAKPVKERCWYSWVSNPPEGGFPSLVEAFREWRFDAREDDADGSVHLEYFTGEKCGNEGDYLFPAIAPFVEDNGSIEARGEDGHQWRFLFENGTAQEQTARISWE